MKRSSDSPADSPPARGAWPPPPRTARSTPPPATGAGSPWRRARLCGGRERISRCPTLILHPFSFHLRLSCLTAPTIRKATTHSATPPARPPPLPAGPSPPPARATGPGLCNHMYVRRLERGRRRCSNHSYTFMHAMVGHKFHGDPHTPTHTRTAQNSLTHTRSYAYTHPRRAGPGVRPPPGPAPFRTAGHRAPGSGGPGSCVVSMPLFIAFGGPT